MNNEFTTGTGGKLGYMVTDEGRRSEVTNKVEMTTGKKKMLDFLEAHILTSLAMLSIFCKIGENSIYFMRSL